MFGRFPIPHVATIGPVSLSLSEEEGKLSYRRTQAEQEVCKQLFTVGEIRLEPVEPVHLPCKQQALQVQFQQPVALAGADEVRVFATIPVDIGVFVAQKDQTHLLDVFSLAPQKLTLYGTSSTGMICRHWTSAWSTEPPETTEATTGILRLSIQNQTDQFVEITQVILRAMGMKLFFDEEGVAMTARMKVMSSGTAETGGEDQPLRNGMQPATEVFPSHLLNPSGKHFVMQGGL